MILRVFFTKFKKVKDSLDQFCPSVESENLKNINSGRDNGEIEQIVQEIQNTCTYEGDTTEECTKKKVIGFLYRKCIVFLRNENIDLKYPTSTIFNKPLFDLY